MFRLLAACLLLVSSALAGGLEQCAGIVVADAPGPRGPGGVRVTYLGTNGYQFETGGRVLLVDPYFTRANLWRVGLGLRLPSDEEVVRASLARLARKADAVIVTHGHFDHALDLPEVMRGTGARLIASDTTVKLAMLAGAPEGKSSIIHVGQTLTAGPWRVTALAARHDCVCGIEPFPGEAKADRKPIRASHWRMGEPLAFLIEGGGKRIYVDSGGRLDGPLPQVGPVDLAIVGVALKDSRERLPGLLRALRPRVFLPSHQDDFFRSLDRPFRFGPLTDFPAVQRMHTAEAPGSRLILLNYFTPWTLR